MKNTLKTAAFAALALVLAASCAKEMKPANEDKELHFTVTTAANAPVKSYLDNNLDGTYTPIWRKGDGIAIFTGSIADGTKSADGILYNKAADGITADFDGIVAATESGVFKAISPAEKFVRGFASVGGAEFVAVALGDADNNYVQNPTNETIDEKCDILVSKPTEYISSGDAVTLDDVFFKRIMSVVKVNVTGPSSLDKEKIQNFAMSSSYATLAGRAKVDVTNAKVTDWTIANKSVKAVYSAADNMPVVNDEPLNAVYFVVNPTTLAESTTLTFSGETDNYQFNKVVTLPKDIVFPEGQIAVINLKLDETHLTSKTTQSSYTLVTNADDLADGDKIVFVNQDKSIMASSSITSNYFVAIEGISFNEDKTSVTLPDDCLIITLEQSGSDWKMRNADGKYLNATNIKTGLSFVDADPSVWTISITKNDATISTSYNETTTELQWNVNANPKRLSNYTSNQASVAIYKLENNREALAIPTGLKVDGKVVFWDAVSGAASYSVTIGTQTFSSETNSYDASAIEDEYYDVAVVAVPSDTENYKNSAAATLTAAKFGTPTLAAPELKEGLIDESSVNVVWTADSKAASGYKCEIYQGENLIATKTVTENSVEFTELSAETEYVVKVNAIAVEGEKPYAASKVASITLVTKAAGTASNDGSLKHPYTAAEAITVIDGGKDLADKYVRGVVKTVSSFNTTYSSLTYDIESGDATLNIYGGLDLGNAGFAGSDDLKAGDEVIVFGTLKKFNSTYEMDKNNYLISVNGETEIYRGLAVSGQKSSFTVGDAFEFGGKVLQVWRGKDDIDVTASATFSGYDMSAEGKQTVTVTVGSETETYEIDIKEASEKKAYYLKTSSITSGKKYLLVDGTHIFDGSSVSKSTPGVDVSNLLNGGQIESNENIDKYAVTISVSGTGYKILLSTGKYLVINSSTTKNGDLTSNATGEIITINNTNGVFRFISGNRNSRGICFRAGTTNCFKNYAISNFGSGEYGGDITIYELTE